MSTARLSDIASIVQGGRKKLTGFDFVDSGYPAFGAGGINGYLSEYEFDRSAVVLSSIGARCGKCFLAEGKWASLANTQLILPDPKVADTRFLWYQLNDESRWHRSGTAQPFIKPSDVKTHNVYLPSIEEQRRIASILDAADALRTKRRQAQAKLNTLTQAIFFDMFGGMSGDPSLCSPLSELVPPEDRINYGVVQPGSDAIEGVPMIRVGDLIDGRVNHGTVKRIAADIDAQYSRSRLVGDEILLSCVGSAGVVALASPKEEGWNIARAVARIPLRKSIERDYVAAFLSGPIAQRYFDNELRTVSQPTLNIKQIKETPIPIPSTRDQADFAGRVQRVRQAQDFQRTSLEHLDALFASLQHRAFRGEL